jgi:hypothetical protein
MFVPACLLAPPRTNRNIPVRTLPTMIAAAALLGLTALPASASVASSAGGPRVHDFSVPGVPGVSAWGSYAKSGGSVSITLCVKDSSAKVRMACVIGVAMNENFTRHKNITADALGNGKQTCRTVKTTDTAELTVLASSVGHDGASRVGKLKSIY